MPALRLTSCLVLLAVLGLASAAVAQASSDPAEPFFPRSGNRGYDVSHYDARLSYRPGSDRIQAVATIAALATQRLRRFSLDLDGLRVAGVSVDGVAAEFGRGRGKLKVVPAVSLPAGARFTTVVRYGGRPGTITDPDGSQEGWYRTEDGALSVGEPVGTATWLPCDNVPADKAGFSFEMTVPAGLKAVANGRLLGVAREGGRRTFEWNEAQPMAPYLALIDIGRGRLRRSTVDGLPAWTLVDPALAEDSRAALASLPDVVGFESRIFGPYPFDSLGSAVDVAGFAYALEAQTRPIYAFVPDRTTVVHEMAHQWFGDSVGLRRWPEIWLNEGFATWTQWYYSERRGGPSAQSVFARLYRIPAADTGFWDPPSGHPGQAKNIFAKSTYVRGAMALQALRAEVGTATMLKTLRRWATLHRHGTAGIAQFVALAEEVSGRKLGPLFRRWLYRRGKPPLS